MKFKLLGLLVILSLTSCGDSSKRKLPNGVVAVTTDKDEVETIFSESKVFCRDLNECPEYVAKITNYTLVDGEYHFGVCSGTLISENKILTNAHCIPKEVSFPGADCSKQVRVKFPPIYTLNFTEERKCLNVISVYDKQVDADLAIITLEDSPHKRQLPIISDKETLSTNRNEKVHAFTMDPSEMNGYITKKSCEASVSSNIIFNELDSYGKDMLITGADKDCKVIGGNSGSGLFDENEELVGVIFARLEKDKILNSFRKNGYRVSPMFNLNNIGMAVNIRCLESFDEFLPTNCPKESLASVSDFSSYMEILKERAGFPAADNKHFTYVIDESLNFRLEFSALGNATYKGISKRLDSLLLEMSSEN